MSTSKYWMGARRPSVILSVLLAISMVAVIPAGSSGITVEPDTPEGDRWTITSAGYRMVLNLASPRIDSFETSGYSLVEEGVGLAPTINTGAPWGPAQATVAMAGPAVTHVVLYGMRWEEQLVGDIEVHFFCYPNRVVARMDIIPHATPPTLLLGWVGNATQAAPFPTNAESPDWRSVLGLHGKLVQGALLLPPLHKGQDGRRGGHVRIDRGEYVDAQYVYNAHDIGTRSIACTLVASADESSLLEQLSYEIALRRMQFRVDNGRFVKYDDMTGMHRFVMKANVDAISISMIGTVGAEGHPFVAAVLDQRRRDFRVETTPSSLTDVQWLREHFDPAATPETNGPGAYVFPLEIVSGEQTLRLQETDASPSESATP